MPCYSSFPLVSYPDSFDLIQLISLWQDVLCHTGNALKQGTGSCQYCVKNIGIKFVKIFEVKGKTCRLLNTYVLLKYQFWKKSLRENATLSSLTLFQHICPHFWAWLLLYSAITTKSVDKYVVKVFNWSEFHLSEMTCYKIHTLEL